MANIAYKKSVKTNGRYADLAKIMGITFATNKNYQIQIYDPAMVIISDTEPTEGGFFIYDSSPFGYTHTGSTLWVKTLEGRAVEINIAEG